MRIALLLRNIDERGGAGSYAQQIARSLVRGDPGNEYVLVFASEAARERHGQPDARNLVVEARSKLLWDQVAVPLALRRERIDVVLGAKHSIPLAPFAPGVFVLHGADWIAFPENYHAADRLYHRVALPLYLKSAERVITISHDSARRILDYMPEVAPKLSVVHHGLPPGFAPVGDGARRAAMRARHGLPERFLLYVGQVYPHKNVGGILRALALLRDRIPHPLVMVGRPSLKAERDMRLVEQLGLGDRVRFTGWVADEDLPVLYSLADAFVFPSLYEGFGIPLLEAMACGCPVVTSTGGSCAEVVGEAGLRVDPTDPAAIAGGIGRVLTEPGLAAELRRRGLARSGAFTWERAARATLAVLAEAAGRGRAREAAAA
jgi:glycosyltransferase involved in cell wall biosynthesis